MLHFLSVCKIIKEKENVVTMKKLLLRSFLLNIMCFLDEKFSKYKNSEGVRQKKNKINIKLELSYFLEYVVNKNRTATIQEVVLKVLIGTQVFFRCLAFRIFFFFFRKSTIRLSFYSILLKRLTNNISAISTTPQYRNEF